MEKDGYRLIGKGKSRKAKEIRFLATGFRFSSPDFDFPRYPSPFTLHLLFTIYHSPSGVETGFT
jgi:hypothetical protein